MPQDPHNQQEPIVIDLMQELKKSLELERHKLRLEAGPPQDQVEVASSGVFANTSQSEVESTEQSIQQAITEAINLTSRLGEVLEELETRLMQVQQNKICEPQSYLTEEDCSLGRHLADDVLILGPDCPCEDNVCCKYPYTCAQVGCICVNLPQKPWSGPTK